MKKIFYSILYVLISNNCYSQIDNYKFTEVDKVISDIKKHQEHSKYYNMISHEDILFLEPSSFDLLKKIYQLIAIEKRKYIQTPSILNHRFRTDIKSIKEIFLNENELKLLLKSALEESDSRKLFIEKEILVKGNKQVMIHVNVNNENTECIRLTLDDDKSLIITPLYRIESLPIPQ